MQGSAITRGSVAGITQAHEDRSIMIHKCIQTDVTRNGWTLETAVTNLSKEIGASRDTIMLALAIANDTLNRKAGI